MLLHLPEPHPQEPRPVSGRGLFSGSEGARIDNYAALKLHEQQEMVDPLGPQAHSQSSGFQSSEQLNGMTAALQPISHDIAIYEVLLRDSPIREIDGVQYYTSVEENTRRNMLRFEPLGGPEYGPSRFDPILPGLGHTWRLELRDEFQVADLMGEEKIQWEVFADNASVRRGSVVVKAIQLINKEKNQADNA